MPDALLPPNLRQVLDLSGQPVDSAFHTAQVSVSFGEAVDSSALIRAWTALASQAPVLRTTLTLGAGGPRPAEQETTDLEFVELDWQANPPVDPAAEWKSVVDADAARPVAVDSPAFARVTLIRLPDGQGHALWSVNGLLLDSDAISRTLHLWLIAYDQFRTGETSVVLPPLPDSTPDHPSDEAYWNVYLAGHEPARPLLLLPLPSATPGNPARRRLTRTFEREERSHWEQTATASGGDLPSLFRAAWIFLIARATTTSDVLILETVPGPAAIGRTERHLPIRTGLDPESTTANFVAEVRKSASAHAGRGRATDDSEPAAAFTFHESTLNDRLQRELPRWMGADVRLTLARPAPVTLVVVASDRPEVTLEHDPALLSGPAAASLLARWVHVVNQFSASPETKLRDVTILLPGEDPVTEGPEAPTLFRSLVPQCLHEIFADIATELTDRPAVESSNECLTFADLNTRATQLARYLKKRNVQTGDRVGLLLGRSPHFATALLGVLRANCRAVLLDSLAETHDGKLLREHKINTLLLDATARHPETLSDFAKIFLDDEAAAIAEQKPRGIPNESAPTSEALAWFTADSGAAATLRTFTHLQLANAAQSLATVLGLDATSRLLQFAPAGSPEAVEETLTSLLSGATLVLPGDSVWATRTAFQEFLEASRITALSIPVAFWSQWTHYLTELRLAVPESVRVTALRDGFPLPSVLRGWRGTPRTGRLVTRFGAPCECGLLQEPTDDPLNSLGTPGPSAAARVVHPTGVTTPPGFPGQLEIRSGKNPFAAVGIDAVADASGLFFSRASLEATTGRPSTGSRVETIAAAASAHPDIFDCVVQFRKSATADDDEPCIWIVPREPDRGEPLNFRNFLRDRLPTALVPVRFSCLPRFPLDAAGHLDPTALPEPESEALPAEKSIPGTPEEEDLRRTISRVLGGRRLRLDEQITDGRTKPHIAKNLHEALAAAGHSVRPGDVAAPFSVRSLLRAVRGRAAAPAGNWNPLQPLRATGKLPPLLLVHDLDGTARPFEALVAELPANQPCYALTARGVDEPAACHQSVEEMASDYLAALRAFDPTGPYSLAGFGFGGLVAFEIARQLTAANATVAFLALVGTEPPSTGSTAARLRSLSAGLRRSLPSFLGGRRSTDALSPRDRRTQESPVYLANARAAQAYAATGAAPLTAHVFLPEHDFLPIRDAQAGWNAACADAHFYQVPCPLAEMLEDPAVAAIATVLAKLAAAEDLADEIEPTDE